MLLSLNTASATSFTAQHPRGQALPEDNDRHDDVLRDGGKKTLYFDITAYWKRTYGDK